ncbi:MAG: DUF479 domain-containing protein [Bernardetiaceae bacterium]|nr:DUF479 domain-containing protein [Bernardetiaceae bacterium]
MLDLEYKHSILFLYRMNLLAHFYLSDKKQSLIIGNFLGDFIKGKKALEGFSPLVVHGIRLHRAIDTFTDAHPTVRRSNQRLHADFGKYAPVLSDIFYDYILANEWQNYEKELSLPDFADFVYQTLYDNKKILTDKARFVLTYMKRDNWLLRYSTFKGIKRTLYGISKRSPYAGDLSIAVENLEQYEVAYKEEFDEFFPELIDFVKEFQKG